MTDAATLKIFPPPGDDRSFPLVAARFLASGESLVEAIG